MTDPDRTQPTRSDHAPQNGTATSTRARIDQIRTRINQLQEEKELELLILQLHDLEQELVQLRSRRRSLPNRAGRARTRSPVSRRSRPPRTRSRSPDRVAAAATAGPSSLNPGALAPAPAAAATASVTAELAVSSSTPVSESSDTSDYASPSLPVKSEPTELNSGAEQPRQPASDANTNADPSPGLEALRPPAEWCQRCLRCMEKEPTLRCVLSPRSTRGKCVRCCNTHGCCEPIPEQCAGFAQDAVTAALAFCADHSSARFDRLINAVSAVRAEMRKYPTPATPKGHRGRRPAAAAVPPSSAPAPAPAAPPTPTPAAPGALTAAPASA